MANIDNYISSSCNIDDGDIHLDRIAALLKVGDQLVMGVVDRLIQNRKIKFCFLMLDAFLFRSRRRLGGNHRAVFQNIPEKIFRTNLAGRIDDVLLINCAQRPQHQRVCHLVYNCKIRQGLTGNLGDAFSGYQRCNMQFSGDSIGRAQHHAFQYYAHLRIINLVQNLGDDMLEWHSHKLYAV